MAFVLPEYLDESEYQQFREEQRRREEEERQREQLRRDAERLQPSEPTPWQRAAQALGQARASAGAPQPAPVMTPPQNSLQNTPQPRPEPVRPEPTPWQRAMAQGQIGRPQPAPQRDFMGRTFAGQAQAQQGQNQDFLGFLRQNVPGFAGGSDILGEGVKAFDAIGAKQAQSGFMLADANPNSPRHELWKRRALSDADREAYVRAVEDEANRLNLTGWLPEGPIRGAAGAIGDVLNKSLTGDNVGTDLQAVQSGTMTPEEFRARQQTRKEQLPQDWERWQTEERNPAFEAAANIPGWFGLGEASAALRAGGGIAKTAAKTSDVLPEASRVARQLATEQRGGAAIGEVLGKAEEVPTKRFYHGTGSAFETPEAGKFDPDGLYGPGYYVTDNADVAGSYANNRTLRDADQRSAVKRLEEEIAQIKNELATQNYPEELRTHLTDTIIPDLEAKLSDTQALQRVGPNVRPIDVPENFNLFRTDAPDITPDEVQRIAAALPQGQQVAFQSRVNNLRFSRADQAVDGDKVYQELADVANGKAKANEVLSQAGYDGLQYPGGRHMPLLDETGKAIQHEALVVFPNSLSKITNALSRTQGGNVDVGTALDIGSSATGAAVSYDPNASPEENAARMAAGGLVGFGLNRAARTGRLGLNVEDVSKGAKQPWEMTLGELNKTGRIVYDTKSQQYRVLADTAPDTAANATEHGRQVAIALFEGKPVPPEVLADYPDLAANNIPASTASEVPVPENIAASAVETPQVSPEPALSANVEKRSVAEGATEAAGGTPPPRRPLWEGQTEKGAPTRPEWLGERGGNEPPTPPTRPGSEWQPSGKEPGGEKNVVATVSPDPYTQLVDALTPTKPTLRDRYTSVRGGFLRAMYDKTMDLKPLEEATGVPAYKLAAVVNGSVTYGEALISEHVRPIFASVGNAAKQLEQYMVGMRLQDILSRNPNAQLPGGIDGWQGALKAVDTVQKRMAPEEAAKIKDAAEQLWKINDELVLKPRLEAGLLSKEQYNAIKANNPHYISFYREDFAGLQTGLSKASPANVTGAGIEALDLAGSTRKLDNPLARFEAQIISTQRLASENRAAKAIVGALVNMEELGKTGGAKTPLRTGEKWARILNPKDVAEQSNVWGTVSYMENGKKVTAQVPKVYADIAKGLEAESADAFTSILRAASAPLRMGAVTYNPAFVVKNPIRDAISAYYREGLVPWSKEYMDGWRAAWSMNKSQDFMDAAKDGVLMSGIIDTQRTTEALARANHLGAIQVKNPKDALLLVPRLIERANLLGEQATRIATYKMLKNQGIDQLSASVRARDVTVDFAKSGNVMKLINQILPFSNAGVQGAANTIRTMKNNPKQAMIGAAPLAMATVLTYAWNQRYETASLVPDYERANNWVIIVGEGTKNPDPQKPNATGEKFPIYIKLPKGPLGSFITSPFETMLDIAWAKDDRSVVEYLLRGAGTMTLAIAPVEPSVSGLLPPLVGTGVGLATNVDTYRQQSIVPEGEQRRPPELQAGPETSRTAIALGEQFKVSPRLIEWAIKDYGAGVGGQGLWLVDTALGALGYNPTTLGEAKKKPVSELEEASRLPVVSSFVGTRSSQERNLGWDEFNQTVTESQRQMVSIPELKRLGILPGPVAETITLGNARIQLDPKERASLQKATTIALKAKVNMITNRQGYNELPDGIKAKVLGQAMDVARQQARANYLRTFSKEALRQRLRESLPVAVGQ